MTSDQFKDLLPNLSDAEQDEIEEALIRLRQSKARRGLINWFRYHYEWSALAGLLFRLKKTSMSRE